MKLAALQLISQWNPAGDELAAKSQELILMMVEQSDAPFSRRAVRRALERAT